MIKNLNKLTKKEMVQAITQIKEMVREKHGFKKYVEIDKKHKQLIRENGYSHDWIRANANKEEIQIRLESLIAIIYNEFAGV